MLGCYSCLYRAVVFIREEDILFSMSHLRKYSSKRINELRNHGIWLYKKYFNSIKSITETTLGIITDRVFPHTAKNYYYWNEPGYLVILEYLLQNFIK